MGSHIFGIFGLRKFLDLGIWKKKCEFTLGWLTGTGKCCSNTSVCYMICWKILTWVFVGVDLHWAKVERQWSIYGWWIRSSCFLLFTCDWIQVNILNISVVIVNQCLLLFQVSNNMYVLVCMLPLNISLLFNLYGSVGCEICKV